MKIKTDFITNSSSTSFLITCDPDFSEEEFMKLVGIETGSPLEPVFIRLYELIKTYMEPLSQEELEQLISDQHPNVSAKLIDAIRVGRKVFRGELTTGDGDALETFFCSDSFEIENEHFYLNCLESDI